VRRYRKSKNIESSKVARRTKGARRGRFFLKGYRRASFVEKKEIKSEDNATKLGHIIICYCLVHTGNWITILK